MDLSSRIEALAQLGKSLRSIDKEELEELIRRTGNENPWFTATNIQLALDGITSMLDTSILQPWSKSYEVTQSPKVIALVLAGNIPFVGFHDLLCVLVSGHKALIKASTKDTVILKHVIQKLLEIEPRFDKQIELTEQLKNFDAVIATGSDNSARYFHAYFGKYPHIIRKNRTSVAILDGFETTNDLVNLGHDVFSHFGLGCRNVAKLYLPKSYEIPVLLDQWEEFQYVIHHHKYCNNYDYQKALLMVNSIPYFDNGCILLTESEHMVSPISVLFYQFYQDKDELKQLLSTNKEKIQCIVGNHTLCNVPFGQAQIPAIDDYADGVDTMKFLCTV